MTALIYQTFALLLYFDALSACILNVSSVLDILLNPVLLASRLYNFVAMMLSVYVDNIQRCFMLDT